MGVQGNDHSYLPSISSDGRIVAFTSEADNLVDGDSNGYRDVFVHDRQTGQTTRVSTSSMEVQGNDDSYLPSISSDGRIVAFISRADNLVDGDSNRYDDIFVHDRLALELELCECDFDRDCDVDGVDLAIQVSGGTNVILSNFAEYFGKDDCLE
jgi:hypothetical protein